MQSRGDFFQTIPEFLQPGDKVAEKLMFSPQLTIFNVFLLILTKFSCSCEGARTIWRCASQFGSHSRGLVAEPDVCGDHFDNFQNKILINDLLARSNLSNLLFESWWQNQTFTLTKMAISMIPRFWRANVLTPIFLAFNSWCHKVNFQDAFQLFGEWISNYFVSWR